MIGIVLLCSCIGPVDSAFKIHGVAPNNTSCEIITLRNSNNEVIDNENVTGEFTKTIVVGGWNQEEYNIKALCNGKEVKVIRGVTGSIDNWKVPVELGNITTESNIK